MLLLSRCIARRYNWRKCVIADCDVIVDRIVSYDDVLRLVLA